MNGSVMVNRAACASRTRLPRRPGHMDTCAGDTQTHVPGMHGHTCSGHSARRHLSNPPSFSPPQPAPVSPQLCPAPSVCPSVCVSVSRGGRPCSPSLSAGSRRSGGGGAGVLFPPLLAGIQLFSLVFSLLFSFSLVCGRCSDLDRDFWNNNDNTVQQKWSSYPPKEFILNISPYAPYGDPRLSLK